MTAFLIGACGGCRCDHRDPACAPNPDGGRACDCHGCNQPACPCYTLGREQPAAQTPAAVPARPAATTPAPIEPRSQLSGWARIWGPI